MAGIYVFTWFRYQTLERNISHSSQETVMQDNVAASLVHRSVPIARPPASNQMLHSSNSVPITSSLLSSNPTVHNSPRSRRLQKAVLTSPVAATPAEHQPTVRDSRWWMQFPAVRFLTRADFFALLQENQVWLLLLTFLSPL